MPKPVLILIIGMIIGSLVTLVGLSVYAPGMMLSERLSPHSVDETVSRLETAARQVGWSIQSIEPLDLKLKEKGQNDILPTRLINLCRGDYAGPILRDDAAHRAAVLMPCTIAVYQKSDGKTYVATMNAGLMGKLFGGVIAEIMGGPVARDQDSFLKAL